MSRRSLFGSALVAALAATLSTAGSAGAVGYAQPNVVSANPVDTTPHVLDGSVRAVAVVDNRVYVGGTFTTVTNARSSTALRRNYLFAFDRTSGQLVSTFAPAVNGSVETIAPGPVSGSIVIGGRFTTVQGTARRSLAMLSSTGALVTSFTAQTDGYVNKVVIRGNRLFAAGRFSTANGVGRSNLAAFDATSGAIDTAFNIGVADGRTRSDGTVTGASIREMDANRAGTRLVVIGNFRTAAGYSRMQIAMVDLSTNKLSTWHTTRYPNGGSGSTTAFKCSPQFDTQMRDVEFSPDGSYFVVVTTAGAPDYNKTSLCDTAARWGTTPVSTGSQPTWVNCTGGDTLYSVAITASTDSSGRTTGAVYVGGHQRWLDNCGGRGFAVTGSFAAEGIGAIDATTGKAIRTWNPGRTRGVGAEELLANADGLYVGSDTERLGGEYHARLGLFPLG